MQKIKSEPNSKAEAQYNDTEVQPHQVVKIQASIQLKRYATSRAYTHTRFYAVAKGKDVSERM